MSAPFKFGFWIEVHHITAEYMYGLSWVVTNATLQALPFAYSPIVRARMFECFLATCKLLKILVARDGIERGPPALVDVLLSF